MARTINEFVQADAADGYILVPHITRGRLASRVGPREVAPAIQGISPVATTG